MTCLALEFFIGFLIGFLPHDVDFLDCKENEGTLTGEQCNFKPDVFLMSFILFMGTFLLILFLKNLRNSSFFSSNVSPQISKD